LSFDEKKKTMNEIITNNIWRRVKAIARKSKQCSAAIAYVSTSKYLSFSDGDILVCDASTSAIESGVTSAKALADFHKAGAQIYSCPGLHAKTMVIGRTVIIGSCNLSESSAKVLRECAVLSTDTTLRSQSLAFIHGLMEQSELIDDNFISRILKIPVSKRRNIFRTKRKDIHFGKRTWIISTAPLNEDNYSDEIPLVAKAEKAVKQKLHKTRADIGWVRWTGKGRFRTHAREGDALVDLNCIGKRVTVSPPVAILHRHDHGNWTRFYYESPNESMGWTSFEKKIKRLGIQHIKKKSTKELTPRDATLVRVAWES